MREKERAEKEEENERKERKEERKREKERKNENKEKERKREKERKKEKRKKNNKLFGKLNSIQRKSIFFLSPLSSSLIFSLFFRKSGKKGQSEPLAALRSDFMRKRMREKT